jgi:hypothetical protein
MFRKGGDLDSNYLPRPPGEVETCHHSPVARHLEFLTGLAPKHMEVTSGDSSEGARSYFGEGLSTA